MGFFAALRILVTSAPALLNLIVGLAEWLKSVFGEDPAKEIEKHAQVFQLAKDAKTPDEKAKAAAAISAIIRRL